MKALYAFQEANHNLQLCGVPTPRTRKMLAQGSHTDVGFLTLLASNSNTHVETFLGENRLRAVSPCGCSVAAP
jgi:isopenicillin N synthase-like dioxygenase